MTQKAFFLRWNRAGFVTESSCRIQNELEGSSAGFLQAPSQEKTRLLDSGGGNKAPWVKYFRSFTAALCFFHWFDASQALAGSRVGHFRLYFRLFCCFFSRLLWLEETSVVGKSLLSVFWGIKIRAWTSRCASSPRMNEFSIAVPLKNTAGGEYFRVLRHN